MGLLPISCPPKIQLASPWLVERDLEKSKSQRNDLGVQLLTSTLPAPQEKKGFRGTDPSFS